MQIKPFLTPLILVAALGVSACGDDEKTEPMPAADGAGVAVAELGETRSGLEAALASFKAGDKAAAEEQVSTAYVDHFELVEPALEEADHELNEKLEDGIREGLRDEVSSDKPAAEVEKAFDAVFADMDKAEDLLR